MRTWKFIWNPDLGAASKAVDKARGQSQAKHSSEEVDARRGLGFTDSEEHFGAADH
jgi:hypothetical protein